MKNRRKPGGPDRPTGTARAGKLRRHTLLLLLLIIPAGFGMYFIGSWLYDRFVSDRIYSRREIVRRWSMTYKLPVELVEAVIRVESGGEAKAVSKKGAKGLMQVTAVAETEVVNRLKIHQKKGDDRLFDADYNVRIGTAYLRLLINWFGGDVYLALAAYNMGPTKLQNLLKANDKLTARQVVEQHGPKETRDYVRKVFAITGGRYARLPVEAVPDAPASRR
jgi:soluble lytic murein transglycosylase